MTLGTINSEKNYTRPRSYRLMEHIPLFAEVKKKNKKIFLFYLPPIFLSLSLRSLYTLLYLFSYSIGTPINAK